MHENQFSKMNFVDKHFNYLYFNFSWSLNFELKKVKTKVRYFTFITFIWVEHPIFPWRLYRNFDKAHSLYLQLSSLKKDILIREDPYWYYIHFLYGPTIQLEMGAGLVFFLDYEKLDSFIFRCVASEFFSRFYIQFYRENCNSEYFLFSTI